eukprot:1971631-Rhodomonas_salina.3
MLTMCSERYPCSVSYCMLVNWRIFVLHPCHETPRRVPEHSVRAKLLPFGPEVCSCLGGPDLSIIDSNE